MEDRELIPKRNYEISVSVTKEQLDALKKDIIDYVNARIKKIEFEILTLNQQERLS